MARNKQPVNPFYVVLLLVGIAFFLTASTYFVMTLRADRLGRDAENVSQSNALMQFMHERGGQVLAIELGLLGLCTLAAMASDGYWSRRSQSNDP
jgi:hypothetical protein